jgi:K+-sensing histidine kinase KdpD
MSLISGTPQRSPEGDVVQKMEISRRPPDAAPWFRNRPGLTLGVASALFAAVLGLRFTVHTTEDPITLLFCLPIALLAVAYGLRAGLLAGLSGILLVAVWVSVEHLSLSVLGWATRVIPMLLLGVLLGDAVDRLRRSEEERRRLEAVAQRHRDAVEFNDSVVQRLSAAKWALEAGRDDRGLEIVTQTLEVSQELVSDLLRDADMGLTGERGRRPA